MAFAPEYQETKIKLLKNVSTQSVNSSINIQNNGFVIKQVLSINALPAVNSIICTNGNADVSGTIAVNALVVSAENEYHVFEQEGTFNLHLQDADITENAQVFAMASLGEISNIVPTENNISCNILININSLIVKPQILKTLRSVGKGTHQKTEICEFNNVQNSISQTFELSNELNLPNNISNILMANANCIVEDVSSSTDMITINGKVYSQILYLSNEEEPKLKQQDYVLDFSQEVLANGTTQEDDIVVMSKVTKMGYEVQGEMNSSKGILVLKPTISINAQITRPVQFESVADAFCSRHTLKLQTADYQNQQLGIIKLNEKIEGSLSLPEDVRINKILCISHSYSTCNLVQDDTKSVHGIIFANIVYQLDDENMTMGAILAEIPFTKEIEADANDIMVQTTIKTIEARSKRVKDIDVQADIEITLKYAQNSQKTLICDADLGEEFASVGKPLGVYIINNAKEVWDIAKMLRVSPQTILEQNPGLTFPIVQPTNVLVYRQVIKSNE